MEYDDIIYTPDFKGITPERGNLLIASPLLRQPYFARSVVCLLDEDPQRGYIGLTLNKSTDLSLNALLPEWEQAERVPVYCGGPVESDRLFMLHSMPDYFGKTMEVMPGLFVGGSLEEIKNYIDSGGELKGKIRFFLGYSGWMAGQLQNEIAGHSWALNRHPDAATLLRGRDLPYWQREVEHLGPRFSNWMNVPEDPSMN